MDNQSRYSSDLHSWSVRPSCRKPGNTSLPNPQALVSGILRPEGCRKPSQYSSSRRKNAGNLCGSDSAAAVYVVWFFLFLSPLVLTFTWWGCYSLRLWHKPTELANSFLFCFCVCFCLYGPFNCISFHKFFRQLSTFSFCSCGLSSALLVLSAIYISLWKSVSALI